MYSAVEKRLTSLELLATPLLGIKHLELVWDEVFTYNSAVVTGL